MKPLAQEHHPPIASGCGARVLPPFARFVMPGAAGMLAQVLTDSSGQRASRRAHATNTPAAHRKTERWLARNIPSAQHICIQYVHLHMATSLLLLYALTCSLCAHPAL
jgi:hypothetical protein